MRDYKKKVAELRLTKPRAARLKRLCRRTGDTGKALLYALATEVSDPCIARYIVRSVTDPAYNHVKMELDCIPCNRDTFNFYRHKFYYNLNSFLYSPQKAADGLYKNHVKEDSQQ